MVFVVLPISSNNSSTSTTCCACCTCFAFSMLYVCIVFVRNISAWCNSCIACVTSFCASIAFITSVCVSCACTINSVVLISFTTFSISSIVFLLELFSKVSIFLLGIVYILFRVCIHFVV